MVSTNKESLNESKGNVIAIDGKYRDMVQNLKDRKIIATASQAYEIGLGIMISKRQKYNPANRKEKKDKEKKDFTHNDKEKKDFIHNIGTLDAIVEEILEMYQPDVNIGLCIEDLANRGLDILYKEINDAHHIYYNDFVDALKKIQANNRDPNN